MSKPEKIYDGITEVKDWLVEEARSHRFSNRKRRRNLAVAATAACLALALIASSLLPGGPMPSPCPSTRRWCSIPAERPAALH